MSSRPSGFNDFYKLIQTHISSYSKDIYSIGNKGVEGFANRFFKDVITKFAEVEKLGSDQATFERKFEQLSADSNESINAVIGKIGEVEELGEATQEYFAKAGQQLIDEILDLKHFLSHFKEIEKEGFESQLKFNWAKNVLKKLVESENAWAIETLKQIVEREDETAFELLIFMKSEHDLDDPLLSKYVGHPGLEKKLREILESDAYEGQENAYQLISNLCLEDCEWTKKLLEEKLKETHPQKLAVEVISDLLISNSLDWVINFVLEQLQDSADWAVNLVFNYISDENRDFPDKLIDQLLNIAQHDREVEHIVTAYAIFLPPEHEFYKKLLKIFPQETSIYFERRLCRMQEFDRNLVLATSLLPPFEGCYFWEDSPIAYKIGVMRLLIRREENLIRVLTKKKEPSRFQKPPVLKCFPKASSVLMGGKSDFTSLQSTVAEILEPHDIPVFYPLYKNRSKCKVQHHNAYSFKSKYYIEMWLQDSSSMHEGEIRVPTVILRPDKIKPLVIESRDRRMQKLYDDSFEAADFGLMGGVAKYFEQLSMLDPLFNKDPSLKTLSIQFTYNEGGNVLTGERGGLCYAIIGKDAVTISESILKRELAQIGLQKSKTGEWVLGKRYLPSQCRLDMDDLRLLFACDYGLASAEQVYFVEQPDYHLDTAMTIVGDNRILLNSSKLAYKKMQDYVSQWLRKMQVEPSDMTSYYARLEKLRMKAIIEQRYEDATETDLKAAGFEVIRVGGRFDDLQMPSPEIHKVNFFNFVSMTTPANKRIVIAMGCNDAFKKEFKKMIGNYVDSVDEIHFLPQDDSERLLNLTGGIHCLTKVCSNRFL